MGKEIFEKANEIKDYVTQLRRHIHKHPELGFQEYETTKLIKKELESYGVEVLALDIPTGAVGILKGTKDGPDTVTAIRADIDALPIVEKTGLEYASVNEGIMHACGHDGNTAILLGTAKLLSRMTDQFSGTVKFIFQPAEETLKGAKAMIEAGALENPKVDSMVALHAWAYLPAGVIGKWKGAYHASADSFSIKIIGESGHGSRPHEQSDSLLTAAHIVVGLQNIVSRQISALESAVLSVCTFNGGTAVNVIPQSVNLTGTVRTHSKEIRESMPNKMEKIIKNTAEAFGCEYEFIYDWGVPRTFFDPEIVDIFTEGIVEAVGEDYVTDLPGPHMGSEDFALFNEKIPSSALFRLGNANPNGEVIPTHSDIFNFNDDAIPYGITAFTQFVLKKHNY